MRRFLIPLCVLATHAAAQTAQPVTAVPVREFRVEASHSDVAFGIGFLGFPVRGRFDDIRGTITYADGNLPASSISVVIGAKSINTGSAHRDEHLRSADFFDVEKYPNIVFTSRTIAHEGDRFAARGTLTIHGVSRNVAILFREATPPIKDPHGSTLVLFSGTLRLSRKDFGIMGGSKFNPWFDEIRSATMADSVDITVDVQAWATDYERSHRYDTAVAQVARIGMDSMIAKWRNLRSQSPDTLKNSEWEFGELGRALMQNGRVSDAVKIQRFTTEVFPNSAAAHAELARGLELSGDSESAIATVRRALAIDPLDTHAMEIAKRLQGR